MAVDKQHSSLEGLEDRFADRTCGSRVLTSDHITVNNNFGLFNGQTGISSLRIECTYSPWLSVDEFTSERFDSVFKKEWDSLGENLEPHSTAILSCG